MALSDIVNTIRTAVYGKDMREAIARGLETVQSNIDNIDSEMDEGFGGGFVLMESEIPVENRKENVLYGLILGNIDDEGSTG